jgi:hypothetical protein
LDEQAASVRSEPRYSACVRMRAVSHDLKAACEPVQRGSPPTMDTADGLVIMVT